jgi:hypothetical protein
MVGSEDFVDVHKGYCSDGVSRSVGCGDSPGVQRQQPAGAVVGSVTEVATAGVVRGGCQVEEVDDPGILHSETPVPKIEEPDDIPESHGIVPVVADPFENTEDRVPVDDGESAKAHILVLRELYHEKMGWIDATVSDLLQRGVSIHEISSIVDAEIERSKPQILKERKERLAQIRDPRKRKDVVPRDGLERQVVESRGAVEGEKKSPSECGVA